MADRGAHQPPSSTTPPPGDTRAGAAPGSPSDPGTGGQDRRRGRFAVPFLLLGVVLAAIGVVILLVTDGWGWTGLAALFILVSAHPFAVGLGLIGSRFLARRAERAEHWA